MKINYRKTLVIILSFAVLLPFLASAAGLIPSDEDIAKDGFSAFAGMINTIINWFISMAAVVAAITFSIAGGQMLLNPENPAKRTEAIKMFQKTVIGLLIVLGAWLIVHTIVAALVKPDMGALRFLSK